MHLPAQLRVDIAESCSIAHISTDCLTHEVEHDAQRTGEYLGEYSWSEHRGDHIGRRPLDLDHPAILRDRQQGQSIRQVAKAHRISTATVQRVLHAIHPPGQSA